MLSDADLFDLWVALEARFPAGRRNVWPYLSERYGAGYAATQRLMRQCADAGIFAYDEVQWAAPGLVTFPETATRKIPQHRWNERNNTFIDIGFVYAPYVPLMVTPVGVSPEEFIPRRGVMTRYHSAP